jgi:hypothetical protein
VSGTASTLEWRRGDGFLISTDKANLDIDRIHRFLRDESYWSRGIREEVLRRAIENSLTFGLYAEQENGAIAQAGFARVVTDRATFAYLGDVFVLPEYRGAASVSG